MIFTISEKDFLDPEKVKIIDGIAGAGKSSIIDCFFKKTKIPYMRVTSTNALKRDAERRYGIVCDTIAGGLFTTENGKFFSSEKYPDIKTVVIDEILQTSPRVIDWIQSHKGDYNIIITTDTKQMLTQENGADFLQRFLEYSRTDDVVYVCLTDTKRARTAETKVLYERLYAGVEAETKEFENIKELLQVRNFSDISYNEDDVFICHTKEIEDYLYREWHLSEDYNRPLLPKGNIAKKAPKNITSYPILSQIQAEDKKGAGVRGYLQIANLATPTRYQGSEVVTGQILYYILEPHSVVLNREIYTVLTRCYDYKSIVLVYVDIPKKDDIKTFWDKPVKRLAFAQIETETPEDFLPDPENDRFKIQKVVEEMGTPDGIAWNPDGIIINGDFYSNFIQEETNFKPRFTAKSLIQKEPYFDLSYMSTVYKILEKHELKRIIYPYTKNNRRRKENYDYYLDIYSAYPTVFRYGRLPIDGVIYTEYQPDKMNFYRYKGTELSDDCIFTDEVAERIPEGDKEFLFATDYRRGSKAGDFLHEKAFKSIEDKTELKNTMHYGYYQKPFLQEVTISGGCYIREDDYCHELLMVAVMSQLLALMMDLQTVQDGYICVDALHFKDISKKWKFVNFMKKNYPDYDYRIKKKKYNENDEKEEEIIYQSYKELKTKKELKKDYEKKRRKNND